MVFHRVQVQGINLQVQVKYQVFVHAKNQVQIISTQVQVSANLSINQVTSMILWKYVKHRVNSKP